MYGHSEISCWQSTWYKHHRYIGGNYIHLTYAQIYFSIWKWTTCIYVSYFHHTDPVRINKKVFGASLWSPRAWFRPSEAFLCYSSGNSFLMTIILSLFLTDTNCMNFIYANHPGRWFTFLISFVTTYLYYWRFVLFFILVYSSAPGGHRRSYGHCRIPC